MAFINICSALNLRLVSSIIIYVVRPAHLIEIFIALLLI